MAEENGTNRGDTGHDGPPHGGGTEQVSPDLIDAALPTSGDPGVESPSTEPPPPSPAPRSRSSSSSSPTVDDRTELQKFIQDTENDEKNSDSLGTILRRLEGDQIHYCSHYADGQTALHMAVQRDMLWAVKQLLDHNPADKLILSEGQDNDNGRQALHLACFNGHRDIAALLLERGADIEATQSWGATALDEACWGGHKDVVELLLRHGDMRRLLPFF